MLHVGGVRVGGAEGRLARPGGGGGGGVRRESYEGDVGDDGAAGQSWRSGVKKGGRRGGVMTSF